MAEGEARAVRGAFGTSLYNIVLIVLRGQKELAMILMRREICESRRGNGKGDSYDVAIRA
jgi:hypothetical protein